MRKSSLPLGGENVFQRVKQQSAEAEKAGIKLIKLSIGQPSGPAFSFARTAAATAIMSNKESMHESIRTMVHRASITLHRGLCGVM